METNTIYNKRLIDPLSLVYHQLQLSLGTTEDSTSRDSPSQYRISLSSINRCNYPFKSNERYDFLLLDISNMSSHGSSKSVPQVLCWLVFGSCGVQLGLSLRLADCSIGNKRLYSIMPSHTSFGRVVIVDLSFVAIPRRPSDWGPIGLIAYPNSTAFQAEMASISSFSIVPYPILRPGRD